jgi:hypothetical protein
MPMQAAEWTKLVSSIPDDCWEGMFFELNTGMNLAVARVMKYTDEFILLRGRVGGTDEEDRVFVVPYESLMMVMFTRPMEDEKIISIFGDIIGGVRRRREDEERKKAHEEEEAPSDAKAKLKKDADKLTEAFAAGAPPGGAQAPGTSTLRERLLQPRPGIGPSLRRPRPKT